MIIKKTTVTLGQAISPELYSEAFKTKTGRIMQYNANEYVRRYEYSDDNGVTWNAMNVNNTFDNIRLSNSIQLQSGRIYTYNTQGQYTGAPRIFYSDDDGDTWSNVPNASTIIGSNKIRGMFLISTGTIIIVTEYGIVYTDDEFNNCFRSNFIINGQQLQIITVNTGFAVIELASGRLLFGANDKSNNRMLYYSDDQGKTWRLNNQFNGERRINKIIETTLNKLILSTPRNSAKSLSSEIWQSDDGGNTWVKLYTFTYDYDIDNFIYLANKQMYIVRFKDPLSNGRGLLYSLDDCNTWDVLIPAKYDYSDYMYPYYIIKNENDELLVSNNRDLQSEITFRKINIIIETKYPKYLDQKGAQEIVTQFKAYCDSLVGGA